MKSLSLNIKKGGKNNHSFEKILFYSSAFLLPFTIMFIAFIALEIHPFGNEQVMVQDAWHQYYPFLLELYRKFKTGESLLYDWRIGLGSGFMPLMAYYLSSPLNFLIFLFPASLLREAFALLILLKIGFAGSFCAYALCRMNNKREYGVIIFSTLYALCSWTCSYYCHIIWLDTFAIFPLVVTGIRILVSEKNCRLYTISLAFSIFANYYMGLLVCIFTVVYFFSQCILYRNDSKELRINLKNIILSSIISILISAPVILPVIMTMSTQSSIVLNQSTAQWRFARGWIESLVTTLAYREMHINPSLPCLYCGVICMVFLFAFYRLPNISRREKIVHTALLLFFYAGVNIDALSYLLNGLHTPVGMPYRFSFMLSFLLIVSSYQVYSNIEKLNISDWLFMCMGGGIYYLAVAVAEIRKYFTESPLSSNQNINMHTETESLNFWLKNILVIAAYLILTFPGIRGKLGRKAFTLLMAFIVGLELLPTVMAGTTFIGTTNRDSYPDSHIEVQSLLYDIQKTQMSDKLYRMEFTKPYNLNAPVLYDYPGVTVFSSTANTNVMNLFHKMGISSSSNEYVYQNATPIVNMFLNLKYLISQDSEVANEEYLTAIRKIDNVFLYENTAYLPVGFMVNPQLADITLDGATPFENQNIFLKAASGIDEDVLKALDIIHVEHKRLDMPRYGYGIHTYEYMPSEDDSVLDTAETVGYMFQYNYKMPEDGCAYVYMNLDHGDSASVQFQDTIYTYSIKDTKTFPAGTYRQGDLFSVKAMVVGAETSGDVQIYVSILDEEVFDKAYEALRDEPLHVTNLTDTGLTGSVTVKENSLLYTSIPYERGWKVYVDGQETEITPIADTFIGILLPRGEHVIELKYSPTYMYMAVFLSFMGIILCQFMFCKMRFSNPGTFGLSKR